MVAHFLICVYPATRLWKKPPSFGLHSSWVLLCFVLFFCNFRIISELQKSCKHSTERSLHTEVSPVDHSCGSTGSATTIKPITRINQNPHFIPVFSVFTWCSVPESHPGHCTASCLCGVLVVVTVAQASFVFHDLDGFEEDGWAVLLLGIVWQLGWT